MLEFSICLKLLSLVFFLVLFLQSSIDKIWYSKDNIAYINSVFEKTFLKNISFILYLTITILEFSSGVLCTIGFFAVLNGSDFIAKLGLLMSAISLLALFFGQRVAKDYAGSVSLASYFAVALISLLIFYV